MAKNLEEYDEIARNDIQGLMDSFELTEEEAIEEYEASLKLPLQEDVFNRVLASDMEEIDVESVDDGEDAVGLDFKLK